MSLSKKLIAGLLIICAAAFAGCTTKESEAETTNDKLQLSKFIDHGSFGGSYDADKGRYKDAWQINYDLELIPDAAYKVWKDSYVATLDGEVIASESDIDAPFTSVFRIEMTFDEPVETGHFVITIYDDEGTAVNVGECEIYKTPPATVADFTDYTVNSSESFVLPGTEITFTLPDCFTLSDVYLDDPTAAANPEILDTLVLYAEYDSDEELYAGCGMLINYVGKGDLEEYNVEEQLGLATRNRRERYDAHGLEYTEDMTSFEIGGYECLAASTTTVPGPDQGDPVTAVTLFVGDYDTIYLITAMGPEDDLVQMIIQSLSAPLP